MSATATPACTPDALHRPRLAVLTHSGVPAVAVSSLLVLMVLIACSPVIDNDFVRWDDDLNLIRNPYFRGLGWGPIRWASTTYHLGVYQPLSWLLFSLEYQLWGLDAFGYHLTSLVLYCVSTVVLARLTVALLSRAGLTTCNTGTLALETCAGLAAGLVAVHPLRVEVVAWASCQPYLPAVLCYMLAILAYLRGYDAERQTIRRSGLAAALALFLAALLFKAVAVSLPVVLAILDVYPLRRPRGRAVWLEKVPFVALSLLFIALAIDAKADAGSLNPVAYWGIGERTAQAAFGVAFYTGKTFVPLGLTAYYPLPDVLDWTAPGYVALIGLVVAATLCLVALRRRTPALLAAWAAYLVILAPNLGIFSVGRQIAADRYCYLPEFLWSTGLAGLFVLGYRRLGPRGRKAGVSVILIAQSALFVLTWRQCATWRDTETLFGHALAQAHDQKAHFLNNIGVALFDEGRFSEARAMYKDALRDDPRYVHAINNLGVLARRLGRLDEAAAYFRSAIELDQGYLLARRNYASLLIHERRIDEAAAQLLILLQIEPGEPGSLTDLARIRLDQSRFDEADRLFRAVLRAYPGHGASRKGLDDVARKRHLHE